MTKKSGRGLVRHLYVRSNAAGESLICVLVNGDRLPKEDSGSSHSCAMRARGAPVSCSARTRKRATSSSATATARSGGVTDLRTRSAARRSGSSVPSFYQVNRAQAERLYAKAIEFADLTGQETVFDLGLRRGHDHTCAVGPREESPRCGDRPRGHRRRARKRWPAQRRQRRGVILRRCVRCGKELSRAKTCAPTSSPSTRRARAWPPDVVESIAEMQPGRVVYVSCDSATMARDVKRLADLGYTARCAPAQWTCSQGRIISRLSACSPKSELQR